MIKGGVGVAKETQKDKIARLEAELTEKNKLNAELFEKLSVAQNELLAKNTSEIENNPLYVQIKQEMERYELLFNQYKGLYEKSESKLAKKHDMNIQLKQEIQELKQECDELKKKTERKHNERGAGRKKEFQGKLTEEEIQSILADRNNGMTFAMISKKYGYPTTNIFKLIKEFSN